MEYKKITILCSEKRRKEAEDLFLELTNKKENQAGMICSDHRIIFNGLGKGRLYNFKNRKNDNENVNSTLELLIDPELDGMHFENVICLGVEVESARVNGYILTL